MHGNIYLSALTQYDDLQGLSDAGKAMKEPTNVGLFSLDDPYIRHLFIERLEKYHYLYYGRNALDRNSFDKAMTNLSKLGKTIIGIKNNLYVNEVLEYFTGNTPLAISNGVGDGKWLYFPSMELIELSLQTINPFRYLKCLPIFGTINLHTLFKLHQKGFHPVNLSSPLVKTNVKEVHGEKSGPFSTIAHDLLVHLYWGSLLNINQYRFLFEYLIPKVANLLDVNIHQASQKSEIFTMVDLYIVYEQPQPITLDETFYICVNTLLKISQSTYFPKLEPDIRVKIWEEVYKDREKVAQQFDIDLDKLILNVEKFYMRFYFSKRVDQSHVLRILQESIVTGTNLIDLYNNDPQCFPEPRWKNYRT